MRKYSAASGPFVGDTERGVPAGPQSVFVARQTESYAISVDPNGVRNWITNELAGDHLICLLSEQVSQDYLELLHRLGISYVVSGHKDVDIEAALSELSTHFGIHTLLLKGDSQVNQSAMQAGWVDEVSLLIVPAIASSNIAPSSRDVLHVQGNATMLKLKFVERRNHDILWVRYDVVRRGGDDRSAIPT
ncbi:riboflavin biosynthesis pyrimidine reductase [Silvibacterium bohemicum]|uniref:Riboflavin biosynthesis pyrimidine reductase n=1 Tax=Silvibacterium bohemicum TaxID=1577686 RepID=A0A841JSQ2_9BACT|nr:dihydrofolate reductase family protein [Silvibacterium bohemicum]MBB6144433.1 riboflavin biosynthesis pyrimidine reductase [Silvibacterium bohemicum]